jgi:hypothetical protein
MAVMVAVGVVSVMAVMVAVGAVAFMVVGLSMFIEAWRYPALSPATSVAHDLLQAVLDHYRFRVTGAQDLRLLGRDLLHLPGTVQAVPQNVLGASAPEASFYRCAGNLLRSPSLLLPSSLALRAFAVALGRALRGPVAEGTTCEARSLAFALALEGLAHGTNVALGLGFVVLLLSCSASSAHSALILSTSAA